MRVHAATGPAAGNPAGQQPQQPAEAPRLAWPAPPCKGAAVDAGFDAIAVAVGAGLFKIAGTLAEAGTLPTEAASFDAASTEFANAELYHLSAIESEVAERTAQEALTPGVKAVGRLAGGPPIAALSVGRALTGAKPGWYTWARVAPFLGLGMRVGEFIDGCVLAPLGWY